MIVLSDEKYLEMAHRMAATHRHDADGPGRHHCGFQRHTLLDFSRAVAEAAVQAEREAMQNYIINLEAELSVVYRMEHWHGTAGQDRLHCHRVFRIRR